MFYLILRGNNESLSSRKSKVWELKTDQHLKWGLPKQHKLNHPGSNKPTLVVWEAPKKKDGFEIKKIFEIERFILSKIKTIQFFGAIINGSYSILSS
jgi:hypothetical protein